MQFGVKMSTYAGPGATLVYNFQVGVDKRAESESDVVSGPP
jgi:hypothetical protein